MPRTGRPPLKGSLVDRLDGSPLAKARAKAILATLAGECTAIDAARSLACNEANFHAFRNRTLQDMVRGLEPRKPGRKAKQIDPRDEEIARLRSELERAQHVIRTLDVRLELAIAGVAPTSRQTRAGSKKRRTTR